MNRIDVVREVRDWKGTPYRHQHSSKGLGTDCLGLLRGVYRALYGEEPEAPPPYSPSWDEAQRAEEMLLAARRNLVDKRHNPWRPGDVLIFRMHHDAVAKHCAIVSSETHMVHAYNPVGVREEPITRFWSRRIAGTIMFPGVI